MLMATQFLFRPEVSFILPAWDADPIPHHRCRSPLQAGLWTLRMSSSVSTLTIYRHFLKALRNYPSVKQPQYIIACREAFIKEHYKRSIDFTRYPKGKVVELYI